MLQQQLKWCLVCTLQEETARAYLLLSKVAARQEQFQDAKAHSEKARELAIAAGANALAMVAKCFIGANLARTMFDDAIQALGNEIKAGR